MKDDKDAPLNINYHKRQQSLRKKRRVNSLRPKKKESNKSYIKINIIFIIIFIILIILLCFLIKKKLEKIEEINLAITEKNKEVELEKKVKDGIKDKINTLNKVLDIREKKSKEMINLYEEKKSEFINKQKIYENIKELNEKAREEFFKSIFLEEAISNLNERINNINNK